MREPVGNDGWYLCDWRDQPDFEYSEFRGGQTFAQQWARQFRGDPFALSTLRRLLGGTCPAPTDERIAQQVAWRLTSRVWLARRRIIRTAITLGTKPEEVAAAFPMEDRRPAPPPRTPAPQPDAAVFPADVDDLAIAAAQKQAAALGMPFCEECLRAQMAGR